MWRKVDPARARVAGQRSRANRAAAIKATAVEPFTARDLRHDWEEYGLYECFYCGVSLIEGYEIEHFYPLEPDDEDAEKGPHALFNLVPACWLCNRGVDGKHSREPWQFLRESLAEQGTDLDAAIAGIEAIAARRRRR